MFLDPLFKVMADKQASDLYITAGAPIQLKVNGVASPVSSQIMDAQTVKKIAYEIMNESQIKQLESGDEVNFSHSSPGIGSFRLNVFHQRGAVGLVMRFLKATIPTIEELKLPDILKSLVMEKIGLILIVGSTGSGKSSTLAAMLDYRNETRTGHILTIEDPIEYIFKHKKSLINQREVGIDTKSFETALINAMRQAPDCIMIGEIRERDTLRNALNFAQAGHLCLATLHANNSYHALNRIISFFPLEVRNNLLADLSVSLRCIMSQRLIKGVEDKLLPAVEILLNTKHISELIKTGEINQIKEAMEQSLAEGSQTFEQDLFKLYSSGQITLDSARAYADSPSNLSWLIENAQAGGAQSTQNVAQFPSQTKPASSDDLSNFKFNMDVV